MEKIGIVYDPVFMLHNPGLGHPEVPERLLAVKEAIDGLQLDFQNIPVRPADRGSLELVHLPRYVDYVLNLDISETTFLDPDTPISSHSVEAALKAVGGVINAVDEVLAGRVRKVFCAVRPPGHHAEPDRAMGFCVFNNIAIGAAHAIERRSLSRVAIVDWDLHHGNGTQDAFCDTGKVLYISLHQAPYYPGSGSRFETGDGAGAGFTINIPMGAGSCDDDYRQAFNETIIPSLRDYQPEMLFVSAGFDAHKDDPLGDINLTTAFFGEMTRLLNIIANEFCGGRLISVLEGGYNLQALKESVGLHLRELAK
jgi:acetoin utilization deacetylase AcuC-like enzyme